MKKCLVLGANGFVGSHLVDELAEAGYAVRAFDRFDRSAQFLPSDKVESYKGDAYNEASVKKAFKGIDYFFHCFSATTPYSSDNDPYSDIDKNLRPSVWLFEQCIESKVKKVVFLSSGGAIYGPIAEKRPASEEDLAVPVSPYGINKLAIENYLSYFQRRYGLKYVAYRLTNPYGPRQASSTQGVIPIFVHRIKDGQELVVYGNGSSTRDYLYIRDATKMIVESFSGNTAHSTYNIGSGKQTTLNQIIKTIEKVTGKKAQVRHEPTPKTFLKKSQINIDRFSEEFHPKATTSLEKGIHLTI